MLNYRTKTNQSTLNIINVSLPSIAILGLAMLGLSACSKSDEAAAQAGAPQMPPPTVNVETVSVQSLPLYKTFSGRTVAYEKAVVVPQISGIIDKVMFREGASVRAGQSLYRINPDNYTTAISSGKAAIEQAKANLSTAKANYESTQANILSQAAQHEQAQATVQRYKRLLKANAISEQEYEQAVTQAKTTRAAIASAKAALKQAEAGIETANAGIVSAQAGLKGSELNLSRTVVRAPISGITTRSDIRVGSLVNAGQTQMVTISKLNPIYVDISQSSADMLKMQQAIKNGKAQSGYNSVELVLEDGTTYGTLGKLALQEAKVDESTGAVTMRAKFDNAQGTLLPGMFVNARIAQTVIPNAMLLPQSAVTRTPKGTAQVFIVSNDSKVQIRPITIAGTYANKWIVTDGLNAGDKVVVIGGANLRPDQAVTVQALPPNTSTKRQLMQQSEKQSKQQPNQSKQSAQTNSEQPQKAA